MESLPFRLCSLVVAFFFAGWAVARLFFFYPWQTKAEFSWECVSSLQFIPVALFYALPPWFLVRRIGYGASVVLRLCGFIAVLGVNFLFQSQASSNWENEFLLIGAVLQAMSVFELIIWSHRNRVA